MKLLIYSCLLLFCPSLNFAQKRKKIEFLNVSRTSIKKIILIDHYNDNYERVWGRKYEVSLNSDTLKLYQTEEYYHSYSFSTETLEFSKMELLKQQGVDSLEMIKLIEKVNIENSKRTKFQNRMDSLIWGTSKMLENWSGFRFQKTIEKEDIDNLFDQINAKHNSYRRYLKSKSIDSLWLSNNSERLFNLWFMTNKNAERYTQAYVRDVLGSFKKFRNMFVSNLLQTNSRSYPYIEMQLISSTNDTTFLYSNGQNLFQIPWIMNERYKSYNPYLPIAISKLLPDQKHFSNRSRLSPNWDEVEKGIIWQIDFKSNFINENKWKKIERSNRKK